MVLESIIVNNIKGPAWDWLFDKLAKHYDECREQLKNSGPLLEPLIFSHSVTSQATSNLLIDLILEDQYPPRSSEEWTQLINKSRPSLQNLFITYLNLDTNSILKADKQIDVKEVVTELKEAFKQMSRLPDMLLFARSTQHLATGLWSLDNGHVNDGIKHLSKASALGGLPGDILAPYLENQIVNNLLATGHSKLALFVHRLFGQNSWDEDYDSVYVYLLLSSNQLTEALKYQRKFDDPEEYFDKLKNFLDQCSRLNLSKDLVNLRMTVKEEGALNYIREAESVMSSRPVTPSASNPNQLHSTRSQQKTNCSNTQSSRSAGKAARSKHVAATSSSATPNKAYTVSVTDSPARNTRSARKKKTTY